MPSDKDDSTGSPSPDGPHTRETAKFFGSGLKRKHIQFVPASSGSTIDSFQNTAQTASPARGSSVADFYLSLVLPSDSISARTYSGKSPPCKHDLERDICGSVVDDGLTKGSMMPLRRDDGPTTASPSAEDTQYGPLDNLDKAQLTPRGKATACSSNDAFVQPGKTAVEGSSTALDEICPICNTSVTDWNIHVRTTVHMASVEHSKIPHHLDRQSEGYKHMVKLGWDPDGDKGLGPEGRGIRFPVKATMKKDNLGIGAKLSKPIRGDAAGNVSERDSKKARLLTAKETRRLEQADRAARQDLHDYLRH